MLALVIYVGLYVFLSVPSVQQDVKDIVCKEMSKLLGGRVEMESLFFSPFSEVKLLGVTLVSPSGEKCAGIEEVAAGIDLWTLISDHKIVLNYAELIGLDARIVQPVKGGELNIQFLIDALSPKDKNKPPTKFDLRFRNIVIRRSNVSYQRPWLVSSDSVPLPMAKMSLSDLRMDLSIPVLQNEEFRFDIRGMQCKINPGVDLRDLSAMVVFRKTPASVADTLKVRELKIKLPASSIAVSDIDMPLGGKPDVDGMLTGIVSPSDFRQLVPALTEFDTPWNINADVHYSGSVAEIRQLTLDNDNLDSEMYLSGDLADLSQPDNIDVNLNQLYIHLSDRFISKTIRAFPSISPKLRDFAGKLGTVSIEASGSMSDLDVARLEGELNSNSGIVTLDVSASDLKSHSPHIMAEMEGTDVMVGELLSSNLIGASTFAIDADVMGLDKNAEGRVNLTADYIEVGHRRITGVQADLNKEGNALSVYLANSDTDLKIEADADCILDGENSQFDGFIDVENLYPESLGLTGKMADCKVSGKVHASVTGNNVDNINGSAAIVGFKLESPDGKKLSLDNLSINVDSPDADRASDVTDTYSRVRRMVLLSDWLDADISGTLNAGRLVPELRNMLGEIFPSLLTVKEITDKEHASVSYNDFNFDIKVKGVTAPYEFFNIPFSPLSDIPISGFVNTKVGNAQLSFQTPHIQQGSNKLIRDTKISVSLDTFEGVAKMFAETLYPAKKGDVQLALELYGMNDKINSVLKLNPSFESSLKGEIAMDAAFSRAGDFFTPAGDLGVHVDILPSVVSIGKTIWSVANGKINYSWKRVSVNNFLVNHANQYIKIDGVASESPNDILRVKLNDIDLDYIFGLLNINYVTFGGMATGEVVGRQLLTKTPEARTKYLRVKGLSYNGAVLGNADLASDYDLKEQKVGIYAVIRDADTRERRANIDGGIWVTRDSLSFGFDANKVNLQFMKPFVSAFCSDLRGLGSGKCKLYGTFSDIDLVGSLRADTVSMKLDFTNTWYHAGGDSVFMGKGLIEIPPLTLYDREHHTAELSGWLRHTYFHEPVFDFKVRDAKSLLCYDTNEKLNPLWYGTIYGFGNGQITGRPGLVNIDMNMSTDDKSEFYYVISDTEEADGMSFLSFTDRRKEQEKAEIVDTVPPYLRKFMKLKSDMEEGSSNVIVSLKGTVTPAALVTLVMDPKGGDKITARGQGALQMDYNMASDDLRMFGTYVLDEGNYNFTLQDIIIKNFTIRKGSMIKFDGDPLNANLDISATYRVNTNLTDLDKSFSSDKELNRTNVPVDAILNVDGPMTHPDITFDIELPSLTSDVERKVKSIVSTNDMMSRQIIYLLALNRFYTPEYTGATSGSGAEWSSMASSTISSQLSNILSQMTDKLSVAPSFRSDKGDFTDMEFDLALSSRLLNNRLLINGNFGYRDRSTSNTQFVGDFDIEYLLSKNGNLRLKAYNHFNDQNYYLRSALTTQGVGVVFRHDFDRLWRRKNKDKKPKEEEKTDSVSTSTDDKLLYDKKL